MNKLVSKNSVQRFKQGRKIIKAADGLKANEFGTEQAYFLGDSGKVFKGNIGSNGKRLTQRYTYKGKQYGSFNGGKTYYDLNDGAGRPLSYKANQQVLAAIGRRSNPKVDDTPGGTGGAGGAGGSKGTRGTSHYFFGNMGGWNRSMGNNITDQESLNMIKEMGMEGKSALDIQNKINEEFGSNAVKADNRWGIQSKAGLKALYDKWKINKPEMSSFQQKIISQLPNLDVKSITPENVSIRKQIAMDGYKPSDVDQHLINISNTITNKTPTYVTANRSETRDWMRSNGINPYSVSGATRAAVRRLRAGQADDNDKLLVKGNEQLYNLLKSYFKKGGLISRNPIERFKSNFR